MKRGIIIVILLIVVVGALGAGWWWARSQPEKAAEFLIEGGLRADRAQEFIGWLGGSTGSEEVQSLLVSGSIEGTEVAIVSEFGGQITELAATEGDSAESGEVLVQLDASQLRAQMAQAEAVVAAAEANLGEVEEGAHPAEILTARAALQQALVERDAAETAWKDAVAILGNPQELDARIVEAQTEVDVASAQIEQARAQRAAAEAERDQYRAQGTMQEKWLYSVHDYQVQAAEAAIDAQISNRDGAEAVSAALKAMRDNPLAAVSQVHLAESQYEMAVAGVRVAAAKLDELVAGPTEEELVVARAQINQAQAAVDALQTRIDMMTLRSPIDGIVTSRSAHAGEAALAGATLLTVANLDEVKLTIYIPEDELGRVYLGQEVSVQVDSFPGRVFTGTVSYISQQAEFTPKNIQTEKERVNMVFAVRVRLPNPDHLLKPGMPADALIGE
jgi:multidrug resistance efflux pump